MCNLYHQNTRQADLADMLARIDLQLTEESRGLNMAPGYVGADQDGPVLVQGEDGIEIRTLRWGFPGIPKGDKTPTPITNIRNLDSRWWKNVNGDYLTEPIYRCLVPFDRFAEWDKGAKANAWFRTTGGAPSFFAGIWRPWHGERLKPVDGKKLRQRTEDDWSLYAFLTTEPNAVVAPIHPKAMPVILTDPSECGEWLAGGEDSLRLQRPLPDDQLEISTVD